MAKFQSDLGSFSTILEKFKENAGIYIFLFLLLGLGFTGVSAKKIYNGLQSENWPTTGGEILSFWEPSSNIFRYGLRVEYQYEVGHKKYLSDKVCYTRNYRMEHAYKNYPIGSKVRVFYNPEHPQQAVLEPGVSWHVFPLLFFGLTFLAFWLWTCVIKKYHLPPEQQCL